MAREVGSPGSNYSYVDLQKTATELERKFKVQGLSEEEKLLGIAASYAIDFIDTARANGFYLDLTVHSEENVLATVMLVYHSELKQRNTPEKSKEQLIKKLAGYELFSVLNSLNESENLVELTLKKETILMEPRLVIQTIPDAANRQSHFVDIYDAIKDTIDKFQLDHIKEGAPFIIGGLPPFYQRLEKDLFRYLP